MKKAFALAIIISALFLCSCAEEKALEPWSMPTVDERPLPSPTPTQSYTSAAAPESYIWNEAIAFNMSYPGASADSIHQTFTHSDSLTLFPYNFMPEAFFYESHSVYDKLKMYKRDHEVLLNPLDNTLAKNAYVEYRFMPREWIEAEELKIMAELCSFDDVKNIFFNRQYPHIAYADGAAPQLSSYYLSSFVLAKHGELRIAQILKLPSSAYFDDCEKASADAAAKGESFTPARQILLTVTCGEKMSDEEFIAAVCALLKFSDGSEITPDPNAKRLPQPGEKGAA